MGGFPDFGCLAQNTLRTQAPHQCAGAQDGNIGLSTLGLSITLIMITTDNTTVVAYINKQGGPHSHTLLLLVVDFFLWLQTQDIAIRARHIPVCLNVIADRLSWLNQPHRDRHLIPDPMMIPGSSGSLQMVDYTLIHVPFASVYLDSSYHRGTAKSRV